MVKVWSERLNVTVNIAIVCACIAVTAVAAKNLFNRSPSPPSHGPAIGSKVSLAGVDWTKSEQSLVLVLSTTCQFCSESSTFYQRLVPLAKNRGVQLVTILPQPLEDSRKYLASLGIVVPEVLQSSPSASGATVTPTLFLVDRNGKVKKTWVGKLDHAQEEQLLASLR